jgi:uncharacterized PurR-regulated membrane protein YhhQ (DUF165 family)
MILVGLYLVAIITANLVIVALGPSASIWTAFVFIGLVLTTRDRLHDRWGCNFRRKMAGLIAAGSVLSFAVNHDAGRIALASCMAFAVSETVDALLYNALRHRDWFERVNGSNVGGALVDSLLFPALAFGAILPVVIVGQFLAKTVGGAIWSVLLRTRKLVPVAGLVVLLATPADAQIVGLGAGSVTTPFGTDATVELYVALPAIGPNDARLYAIAALTDATWKPIVVTSIDTKLVGASAGMLRAGPGFTWLPFDNYTPHASVTATAIIFLPFRLQIVSLASTQVADTGNWSVVFKLNRTLYFGQ